VFAREEDTPQRAPAGGLVAIQGGAYNRMRRVSVGHEGKNKTMINVSTTAASKINELLTEEGKVGSGLRVFVQGGGCSGFQYGLMIEEGGGDADQVFESNGVRLFVDPVSISYLKGAEVDFVDTVTGGGFTIKNPNAVSTCGCGSSFSV
jgi:iron-sulfur cluster insertion protein